MAKLAPEIVLFFKNQSFTIISTIDKNGRPHSSCKGIVKIDAEGNIYILDLYRSITFSNLQNNSSISITAVDEHKFRGYCLKGKARIADVKELEEDILKEWETKIASRISQRVLKNIKGDKGHQHHPETQLPIPQYMISISVEEVVDLTPKKLKQ